MLIVFEADNKKRKNMLATVVLVNFDHFEEIGQVLLLSLVLVLNQN